MAKGNHNPERAGGAVRLKSTQTYELNIPASHLWGWVEVDVCY
jgi:hypothetical protein